MFKTVWRILITSCYKSLLIDLLIQRNIVFVVMQCCSFNKTGSKKDLFIIILKFAF